MTYSNGWKIWKTSLDLDWIEYMEHPYLGFDDKEYQADGISINSAYRLQDMGVQIDDIDFFLDCFVEREGGRWRSVVDRYWTSESLAASHLLTACDQPSPGNGWRLSRAVVGSLSLPLQKVNTMIIPTRLKKIARHL